MNLSEFLSGKFLLLSHRDRIERLFWFLHSSGKENIKTGDIRILYEKAHVPIPNISQYLKDLSERKPKILIKSKDGFRLEATVRNRLSLELGEETETILVNSLLGDLGKKIKNKEEKIFLEEALACYKVKAFRATIVMSWNLAFSHLKTWILSDSKRMADFNDAVKKAYPNNKNVVLTWDGFDEFKEFEVIEICRVSRLVSKNIVEIMREKLKKRNQSAHPSSITVTKMQADEVVTDLVNNIILQLE